MALLQGCAFLNRENTPTLNLVRDNLVPENPSEKWYVMPAVYPVGMGAVTLDALIVHPATVIDDAAQDTREVCWTDLDWEEEYVTECAAMPWRTGATPAVFGGSFLARSMFDVPARADEQRQRDRKAEAIARARTLLDQGKSEEALKELRQVSVYGYETEEDREYAILLLRAVVETNRYEEIDSWEVREMTRRMPSQAGEIDRILDRLRASPEYRARWKVALLDLERSHLPAEDARILVGLLRDPTSPALRYKALGLLEGDSKVLQVPELRRAVEDLATNDPDPLVREEARSVLAPRPDSRSGRYPGGAIPIQADP
jgi:hypothetical protein